MNKRGIKHLTPQAWLQVKKISADVSCRKPSIYLINQIYRPPSSGSQNTKKQTIMMRKNTINLKTISNRYKML